MWKGYPLSYSMLREGTLPIIADKNPALRYTIMNLRRSTLNGRECMAILDSQGHLFELITGNDNTVSSGSTTAWADATSSARKGNEVYALHSHLNDVGASFQDFVANEEIARATGIMPHTIIITPSKVYDYVPGETGYGGLTPNHGQAWYERHGIKLGEEYREPKWFLGKAYVEYGYMHGLFDKDMTVEDRVRRRDATIMDASERLGFKVHVYSIEEFETKTTTSKHKIISQLFKEFKNLIRA
jgi:hypothetical protein